MGQWGNVVVAVIQIDADHLKPVRSLRRRRQVGLAVIDAEVGAVALDPGALRFFLAHLIEHARRVDGRQQGASASPIFDSDLRPVGLPDVVDQLNGDIGPIRDPGPFRRDPADGVVVVLCHRVRTDERVDDDDIQLEFARGIQHSLDIRR